MIALKCFLVFFCELWSLGRDGCRLHLGRTLLCSLSFLDIVMGLNWNWIRGVMGLEVRRL